MLFLEDYLRAELPAVPSQIQNRIRMLVALQPGLTLAELIACATPGTADDIYILIVTDALFVDLEAVPLAEPERVSVFCDEHAAQHQKVVAPSLARRSLLNPETGTLIFDLTMASPEDLVTAYHRYISIAPDLAGEISTQSEQVPDRTKRRWFASYRTAEKKYGVGFVGLIPHTRHRGN